MRKLFLILVLTWVALFSAKAVFAACDNSVCDCALSPTWRYDSCSQGECVGNKKDILQGYDDQTGKYIYATQYECFPKRPANQLPPGQGSTTVQQQGTIWVVTKPGEWLSAVYSGIGFGINPALGAKFLENNLVPFLISLLFFVLILASLIFTIIGGIMWIMSSGNKEGLTKAKSTVTYALVGLVIGLSAYIIVNLLFQLFGVIEAPSSSSTIGSCNECVISCGKKKAKSATDCETQDCKNVCATSQPQSPLVVSPGPTTNKTLQNILVNSSSLYAFPTLKIMVDRVAAKTGANANNLFDQGAAIMLIEAASNSLYPFQTTAVTQTDRLADYNNGSGLNGVEKDVLAGVANLVFVQNYVTGYASNLSSETQRDLWIASQNGGAYLIRKMTEYSGKKTWPEIYQESVNNLETYRNKYNAEMKTNIDAQSFKNKVEYAGKYVARYHAAKFLLTNIQNAGKTDSAYLDRAHTQLMKITGSDYTVSGGVSAVQNKILQLMNSSGRN